MARTTNSTEDVLEVGDQVTVRPDVKGWAGSTGTVVSIASPGTKQPVRVIVDDDEPDGRGFEVDELMRA